MQLERSYYFYVLTLRKINENDTWAGKDINSCTFLVAL